MVRAEICGYDIKLQPQIQLNSGELVGAEVLIRGVGRGIIFMNQCQSMNLKIILWYRHWHSVVNKKIKFI